MVVWCSLVVWWCVVCKKDDVNEFRCVAKQMYAKGERACAWVTWRKCLCPTLRLCHDEVKTSSRVNRFVWKMVFVLHACFWVLAWQVAYPPGSWCATVWLLVWSFSWAGVVFLPVCVRVWCAWCGWWFVGGGILWVWLGGSTGGLWCGLWCGVVWCGVCMCVCVLWLVVCWWFSQGQFSFISMCWFGVCTTTALCSNQQTKKCCTVLLPEFFPAQLNEFLCVPLNLCSALKEKVAGLHIALWNPHQSGGDLHSPHGGVWWTLKRFQYGNKLWELTSVSENYGVEMRGWRLNNVAHAILHHSHDPSQFHVPYHVYHPEFMLSSSCAFKPAELQVPWKRTKIEQCCTFILHHSHGPCQVSCSPSWIHVVFIMCFMPTLHITSLPSDQ